MKNLLTNQGKALFLSAALLGTSMTSLSVTAGEGFNGEQVQQQQKKKGKHHKKQFKKMVKLLELSEEQQVSIKAIYNDAKAAKAANKDAMKAFKTEVNTLAETQAEAEHFEEQAFLDVFNNHSNAFAQQVLISIKKQHEINKVLTEEQRGKWKAFKAGRRSNR